MTGFDLLPVDLQADACRPGEPYHADLTSADANADAVAAALERFGRLDIVVADADVKVFCSRALRDRLGRGRLAHAASRGRVRVREPARDVGLRLDQRDDAAPAGCQMLG